MNVLPGSGALLVGLSLPRLVLAPLLPGGVSRQLRPASTPISVLLTTFLGLHGAVGNRKRYVVKAQSPNSSSL